MSLCLIIHILKLLFEMVRRQNAFSGTLWKLEKIPLVPSMLIRSLRKIIWPSLTVNVTSINIFIIFQSIFFILFHSTTVTEMKYKEAETLYIDIYDYKLQNFGESHEETFRALNNVGVVYRQVDLLNLFWKYSLRVFALALF